MFIFAQRCIFGIFLFLLPHLQGLHHKSNFLLFQNQTDTFCPNPHQLFKAKSELRILKEGLQFNDNDNDNHDDHINDDFIDETDSINEEIVSETAVTLRLYGNTVMGYYYVTLFFGSQLQRQNLIVDTGSTITTIPCTGIILKLY